MPQSIYVHRSNAGLIFSLWLAITSISGKCTSVQYSNASSNTSATGSTAVRTPINNTSIPLHLSNSTVSPSPSPYTSGCPPRRPEIHVALQTNKFPGLNFSLPCYLDSSNLNPNATKCRFLFRRQETTDEFISISYVIAQSSPFANLNYNDPIISNTTKKAFEVIFPWIELASDLPLNTTSSVFVPVCTSASEADSVSPTASVSTASDIGGSTSAQSTLYIPSKTAITASNAYSLQKPNSTISATATTSFITSYMNTTMVSTTTTMPFSTLTANLSTSTTLMMRGKTTTHAPSTATSALTPRLCTIPGLSYSFRLVIPGKPLHSFTNCSSGGVSGINSTQQRNASSFSGSTITIPTSHIAAAATSTSITTTITYANTATSSTISTTTLIKSVASASISTSITLTTNLNASNGTFPPQTAAASTMTYSYDQLDNILFPDSYFAFTLSKPTVTNVTGSSFDVAWDKPLFSDATCTKTPNACEVLEYRLQVSHAGAGDGYLQGYYASISASLPTVVLRVYLQNNTFSFHVGDPCHITPLDTSLINNLTENSVGGTGESTAIPSTFHSNTSRTTAPTTTTSYSFASPAQCIEPFTVYQVSLTAIGRYTQVTTSIYTNSFIGLYNASPPTPFLNPFTQADSTPTQAVFGFYLPVSIGSLPLDYRARIIDVEANTVTIFDPKLSRLSGTYSCPPGNPFRCFIYASISVQPYVLYSVSFAIRTYLAWSPYSPPLVFRSLPAPPLQLARPILNISTSAVIATGATASFDGDYDYQNDGSPNNTVARRTASARNAAPITGSLTQTHSVSTRSLTGCPEEMSDDDCVQQGEVFLLLTWQPAPGRPLGLLIYYEVYGGVVFRNSSFEGTLLTRTSANETFAYIPIADAAVFVNSISVRAVNQQAGPGLFSDPAQVTEAALDLILIFTGAQRPQSTSNTLSSNAIGGIVAGCVSAILIVLLLVFLLLRKSRRDVERAEHFQFPAPDKWDISRDRLRLKRKVCKSIVKFFNK